MAKIKFDDLVNRLKTAIFTDDKKIDAPVKFMDAKLVDGTDIKFLEEFIIGAGVQYADGTVVPDGEYELEDGSKFTVKDGLVESITPKVEDAPVVEVEQSKVEIDPKVTELENKIKELELKLTEKESEIVKLSKTPIAEPVKIVPEKASKIKKFYNVIK